MSNENGVFSVGTVASTGLYQYKFDFNTSKYTGKYIIFEALTNNGYQQSFDNLWIGPKPAIDVITQFSVDSVVIDAARISIPDETIAMFDLVYGAKGFDPATTGTLIDSIESRVYNLVGINPDTEYDVYVRARNAAGQVSSWSRNPVSFRTLCAAVEISDNSIFLDFKYTISDSSLELSRQGHLNLTDADKKGKYQYYALKGLSAPYLDNGGKKFRKVRLDDFNAKEVTDKLIDWTKAVIKTAIEDQGGILTKK